MQKDIEIAKRIAECRDVQAALELARVHYVKEVQKVRAKRRDLTGHCIECLADMPYQTSAVGVHADK